MAKSTAAKRNFEFVGGDLSLDYVNTVGGKRGGIPREFLTSYFDFLEWCHQSGLVNKAQAHALAEEAAKHTVKASGVFTRAVELREAMYRTFLAISENKSPSKTDLATLNSELARGLGRLRLASTKDGEGFAWQWAMPQDALDHPLGPLAHAAANLLTAENRSITVGQCQGDNCGWLFIDSSKNHSRRWCDMRDCGNRAKVRRHRLRQHKSSRRHPAG